VDPATGPLSTWVITSALAGAGALAYGIRVAIQQSDLPGRLFHAIARITAGVGFLVGAASLAGLVSLERVASLVSVAVLVAFGSIVVELVRVRIAARRSQSSEAERLRRHVLGRDEP